MSCILVYLDGYSYRYLNEYLDGYLDGLLDGLTIQYD